MRQIWLFMMLKASANSIRVEVARISDEQNEAEALHYLLQKMGFLVWYHIPVPSAKKYDHIFSHFKSVDPIIYKALLKADEAIYGKFEKFFGGTYIPKQILLADDQAVRDIGLSWAKVRYFKDLAQKFQDKAIAFDSLEALPDAEVIRELTKVKGVGSWTAEMFLMEISACVRG